jgi:two-component system, NarL family, response regulator DesR
VNKVPTHSGRDRSGADRTNLSGLTLTGPLGDGDVVEPEPLVVVVAEPSLLQRRIMAALDFDRLRVVADDESSIATDPAVAPPIVAVVAARNGDSAMPGLQEVRRRLPHARVVLVLEGIQGGPLRRALRGGATAAVEASGVETGLALAVRAASAGLVVVPEAMRERLEPPALSPREREVLALAADGSTTSQIANRLTVSPGTVKRHLSSCFAKLGVENRSEALALLLDADSDTPALR